MLLQARDPASLDHPSIGGAGRRLRVLLVFPPDRGAVQALWTYHLRMGYKPPLGTMWVATHLRERSEHEVRIVDCQAGGLDDDALAAEVRRFDPDLVGITAWTNFWWDAWRAAGVVKAAAPRAHVSVGGPHPAIYPAETLAHEAIDSVVLGDGEVPFTWLANLLSHDDPGAARDLPGVHLAAHGVKGGDDAFYVHRDLDSLPFPDRRLLPVEWYTSPVSRASYVTTLITSRGCPFQCTFCKLHFQKVLCRSAENVLAELEDCRELGIREIEFYDDTFTWSEQRLIAICRGMVRREMDFDWAIRDRVTAATMDAVGWLAKAGCRRIHYGVEAGADVTLDAIKKQIDVGQAERAVRLAKGHGIQVLTYFMLGLPGETMAEVRETIAFARRLDPDYATFAVCVPYAGTEMYEQGLARGIIPRDHWQEYAERPTPGYVVPYFWEEHLTKADLVRARDEAVRSFFFRPSFLWKEIRRTASLDEVRRKLRMAWILFADTVLGKGRRTYGRAFAPAGVSETA